MKTCTRFTAAFALAVLWSVPAHGASLLSTPAPIIVLPGETYLSPTSFVTAPGSAFWGASVLEWTQAGPVSIQVAVSDDPGISKYFFQMTGFNKTSDAWSGFQIDLSGPATFSTAIPPSIGFGSTSTINPTNTSVVFSGVDWPATGSKQITSELVVTAPVADEPLIMTFTPIPVPEPGSAALILLGSALVIRRRR